jgi:hypothetical protein
MDHKQKLLDDEEGVGSITDAGVLSRDYCAYFS